MPLSSSTTVASARPRPSVHVTPTIPPRSSSSLSSPFRELSMPSKDKKRRSSSTIILITAVTTFLLTLFFSRTSHVPTSILFSNLINTSSLLSSSEPLSFPHRYLPDDIPPLPEHAIPNLPPTEAALHAYKLRVNYSAVWMAAPEVNLILRALLRRPARTYLEWGSGGSTLNFAQFARSRAISIEHNEPWCNRMRELLPSSSASHVEFHCVPVVRGSEGWGISNAYEEGTYKAFHDYVDEIEHVNLKLFDFILIDGRARVDCAIKALAFITDDSVVVVHDSSRMAYSGASSYREVLNYYDTVESALGMGRQGVSVLRRRPDLAYLQGNVSAVNEILREKYKL